MTKKERDIELTEMVNEVLESLFYGDPWWNDGKPLTAERFYGDILDKETGIAYDALDWFTLPEDAKEDFVRGNIDEMSSVFVDAKEIAQRLFKVYKKCLESGMEYGSQFHFDDWPIIGGEMIIGFEIDKDGKFIYIAEDQRNPLNDYFVRLSTKEEFEQMIPILENEFLA